MHDWAHLILVALVIVSEVAEHANQSMKYGVSMFYFSYILIYFFNYYKNLFHLGHFVVFGFLCIALLMKLAVGTYTDCLHRNCNDVIRGGHDSGASGISENNLRLTNKY